ncbi:hypothetical protein BKA83DRAFT_4130711 [Pisolithus microcarpus]|nr:hypothetical protein BKA83DRAFT_4130711 [Pisolithus microcarpus]
MPSSSPSLDDFHDLPAYDNFDVVQPDHNAIDTFVPFGDSDFDGEERIWNPSIAESAALLAELGQGHQIQPFSGAGVVCTLPLSFWTAKELRSRIELLPTTPHWNYRIIATSYPMKSPAILYFHDSLECIEALFNHLYYADHMMYTPFRVFTSVERVIREFSEWMSGDMAWWMQMSPVTMASHKDFGDAFRHECCTGARMLSQLSCIQCDPNNLERYFTQCKEFRLSGVVELFWWNWPLTDPANFLMPEPLHHWYRKFWDHDVQWCKNALGAPELDFCYSVLHPIVGMHHFKDGIMALKQVTGRAQRDMQRFMVAVIGGAASQEVVIMVCALMDFQYLAQAPRITSIIQDRIKATLAEFHNHKDKITDEGLRRGAESSSTLDHWFIPKLELMQSVTLSISKLGVPVQWSADTMEHAHIEVIKEPASTMNHQNYNTQICHYLDHVKRCQLFETATRLSTLSNADDTHDQDLATDHDRAEDGDMNMADNEDAMAILKDIWSSRRSIPDLFSIAERLRTALPGSVPQPVHMFSLGATALCINHQPSIKHISIDKAAELFDILDLRGALADYLGHEGPHVQNFHSFGRQWHSPPDAHLPFSDLQVWYKVDVRHEWPASGLTGHTVVDVHLIMCPVSPRHSKHFTMFPEKKC